MWGTKCDRTTETLPKQLLEACESCIRNTFVYGYRKYFHLTCIISTSTLHFLRTTIVHLFSPLLSFLGFLPWAQSFYYVPLTWPVSHFVTMSKTFSQGEVSSHNKPDSLWIIVDEDVYDLTKFQDEHPGKPLRTRSYLNLRLIDSRWKEE